ncbi:hypothetical protein BX600DRAFT_469592 [Xylariales sp. PMI_506]|nr:hypothetical protein BX600DRAFT_469592 [Xylariales sp. PMI_506]
MPTSPESESVTASSPPPAYCSPVDPGEDGPAELQGSSPIPGAVPQITVTAATPTVQESIVRNEEDVKYQIPKHEDLPEVVRDSTLPEVVEEHGGARETESSRKEVVSEHHSEAQDPLSPTVGNLTPVSAVSELSSAWHELPVEESTSQERNSVKPDEDVATNKEGYQPSAGMAVPPANGGDNPTVTPLHLLGDQSDIIDCPFCRHRAESEVKKTPSPMTYVGGTLCCLTTLCGAVVPFFCGWWHNVDHYCTNCGHKLKHQSYDKKKPAKIYGTPEELREPSKYPAAPPKAALSKKEEK